MISTNKKLKECEVDFEGRRDAVAKREDAVSKTGSRSNPRIFAMIAKISLGLRKFRNHSENFAIIAKISQS